MKIKKYCQKIRMLCFAASGLLILLTSCKKEVGPKVLRADMSEYAVVGQKAYIDLDRYSCFAIGENVRVNNSTGSITALERNDRQCAISGVSQSVNYYAFYPQNLLTNPNSVNLSNGLNGIQVTLPNVQTFRTDANGYQIVDNPMFAVLEGANENNYTLHFRNLCALLKLTICTGVAFDAIKLTLNSNQTHYLSGTGTIDYNNNKITISSGNDNVTLALPQGHVGNPLGESFYIMVPEFNIGNNGHQNSLVIEIMNGTTVKKRYTKNLVNGNSILANHIYQIQTLSFDNTISKVFSVSTNKTVVFAPGNLQWSYSAMATSHSTASSNSNDYQGGTWRFAPHQYDIVGNDNANAIGNASGVYAQTSYTGWIDLFAWGGSGYGDSRPFYYFNVNNYYYCRNSSLGNYDWGAFNAIYNPKTRNVDPYGTWRMLTQEEWNYVLYERGSNSWWRYNNVEVDFGSGIIVNGLIIYPDEITSKPAGISSYMAVNLPSNYYTISKAEYDILEDIGCAFLPTAGKMVFSSGACTVTEFNVNGLYWTDDSQPTYNYATALQIRSHGGAPSFASQTYRTDYNFCSVRLARDVN